MSTEATPILLGMNARLFPSNWRPALGELAFAAGAGFRSLQINGREQGVDAGYLGDEPAAVGAAAREAGVVPVMEIVVRLTADMRTPEGRTATEVLRANLPAIAALGCARAHWHLAPATRMSESELRGIERAAIPLLAEAVELARPLGVGFGLEHNEPDIPVFADIGACAEALAEVPGLGFVWDVNHTTPDAIEACLALAPRMSMLHLSDTPLPEVNHHLPVGLGSVDFRRYLAELLAAGFRGPAILEIGGLPKSGGYGRDTDEALADSLRRLEAILGAVGS